MLKKKWQKHSTLLTLFHVPDKSCQRKRLSNQLPSVTWRWWKDTVPLWQDGIGFIHVYVAWPLKCCTHENLGTVTDWLFHTGVKSSFKKKKKISFLWHLICRSSPVLMQKQSCSFAKMCSNVCSGRSVATGIIDDHCHPRPSLPVSPSPYHHSLLHPSLFDFHPAICPFCPPPPWGVELLADLLPGSGTPSHTSSKTLTLSPPPFQIYP